jgi:hypothetical protein
MRKNNQVSKNLKPRVSGKAKFLSILMFFQAVFGWAQEQWAVVLRQMGQPYDNTITTILLDRLDSNGGGGDGLPDASLWLLDTNMSLTSIILEDLLQRGVKISFDDTGVFMIPGGMDYIEPRNLLTVDGRDILDLFPNMEYAFPFAASRRAAAQQSQRGR